MPTETLTTADARKLAEESDAIAKAATQPVMLHTVDTPYNLPGEPGDAYRRGYLEGHNEASHAIAGHDGLRSVAAALSSLADQLDGANAENAAMREAAAYAMDGMEEARSKKELAAHLAITCLANAEYEAMPGGKTFRKRAAASTTKASPQ